MGKFTYVAGSGQKPKPFDPYSLPRTVEEFIANGAPEGERNRALFSAAAQLRDIDKSQESAEDILTGPALAWGLGLSEISLTIASAYRGDKREAPVRAGGTAPRASLDPGRARSHAGVKYRLNGKPTSTETDADAEPPPGQKRLSETTPIPLPEPIEGGFEQLLMVVFEEGEGVCVGDTFETDDGDHAPDKGVTLSREQWIQKVRGRGGDFSKMHTGKHGHYIRVNPMRIDPKSRNSDADVTAFRHLLVEFDTDASGKTIPKEQQFGALLASRLPISAVIDSGNKSIHAWVRVDAKSLDEYKQRAEEVYSLFDAEELDGQNHNPNRYSRAPDGIRTVDGEQVKQRLLKVKLGAESWEDYLRIQQVRALGEPWRPMRDFENYNIKDDPNTVIGQRWLCKGGNMVFVSQSGVGKSSLQMQLKAGWAIGRTDMTFHIKPVRPLKQLTLQAENDQGDVAEVWQGVTRGYGLSMVEKEAIDKNCLWHRITTLVGDEFLNLVDKLVSLHQPDICWIDPLLNYIGDDVSKGEVISRFCQQGLNLISQATGVIFILVHHAGKPKAADVKAGMTASDLAYMGLGSSVLTNWAREVLVMNRVATKDPNEPATFTLTATKRRTRAGMMPMVKEGADPLDALKVTSEIHIRHSNDGRIRWVQCPAPDSPDPPAGRGKGAPKQRKAPRLPGRGTVLTADCRREIIRVASQQENGKLTMALASQIAAKHGYPGIETVRTYPQALWQWKADREGSQKVILTIEEALEGQIQERPGPVEGEDGGSEGAVITREVVGQDPGVALKPIPETHKNRPGY